MIVDCAIYTDGRRRDGDVDWKNAYAESQRHHGFVWIGLKQPQAAEFSSLQEEFGLHPLAVEDAIKAHQRPKLEVYDEMVFIVLKTARYVDEEEAVEFGEIAIFLGPDYVITVRHGEGSDLHPVRERLETRPELLRCGPGAVLHAIIDQVVDDYQPAIDGLEEDIEQIEAEIFSAERRDRSQRIYRLKREVLELAHAAAPLIEPVERLARGQYELVHQDVRAYFRDVSDHLIRVNQQLESFRDLLTSVLEANLSQVTVRQNEDVRKISAVVAIIAVPTMIAGVYGMNFEHMPELHWELGYPLALAVMAAICLFLYRYFKRIGWL